MIDFSKVQKGTQVVLKDGRKVFVSGLYLSGTGPMLMVKGNPGQTAAENVNLELVLEIVEA